ncbi:TNT domain-containing protein [Streptomyces sp. J2-1]|uniref:TNT domain-containing protein n=1 Tax=Streptomyces corallincola TaxID=2851888 RepID=UPI001C38FECC|nr:TNT domain-containing protein [Streptomyces corallincola]MBV2356001.1 TNT domain-containing protein [Streptomyces corallincola]
MTRTRLLRRLVMSALASTLLLLGITPAPARAATPVHTHGGGRDCPVTHRAASTTTAPPTGLEAYYGDDWRLGPSTLPSSGPVARMLRGYSPQDGTSRYWFLGCYWQTDQQNKSGWWYPDNNGFVLRDGRPVQSDKTLQVGTLVDLFGSGRGNFLAPAGTPYAQRAIPPTNLDAYNTTSPAYNYHLYRVTKSFTVQAGPIRPWFGQPGLGQQYLTTPAVPALVSAGNLEEIPSSAAGS